MRKEKGFTLIELMIVVAIIGILAAIAIPRFAQLIDKAREAGARGNLGALRSAIAIYYGDNRGVWPVSLDNTATHELYGHTLPAFVKAYMGKIPKATLQRGISDHNDKDTVRYVQTQAHDEIDATGINDAGGWVYSSRSGDCRINCNHRDTSPYTTLYYSNYGHEEP